MARPWGLVAGTAITATAALGWPALIVVPAIVLLMTALTWKMDWQLAVVGVVSVAIMLLRAQSTDVIEDIPNLDASIGAIGTIGSLPKPSDAGQRFEFEIETLIFDDRHEKSSGMVLVWVDTPRPLNIGDRLELSWDMESSSVLAPGFGRWVESQMASGAGFARLTHVVAPSDSPMRFVSGLRRTISGRLQATIPGDAGVLAAGIVIGDDANLSEESEQAFLNTGTSHVTAVSGSNILMLTTFWNIVIPARRFQRRFLFQLAMVGLIWGYALLVGAEPPVLRAAIVATLALFAFRFGRMSDPLSLLMIASGVLLLWNPIYAYSASFWLSVVASLAFVTVIPTKPIAIPKWRIISVSVLGIFLANVMTLPLVILFFGQWSPVSLIANLVIAPLLTLAFPLAFVLGLIVLVAEPISGWYAWLPALTLDFLLGTLKSLASFSTPLLVDDNRRAAALIIAFPCILVTLLASRDARRWGRIVEYRWTSAPTLIWIGVIGPALGILVALLIQAFSILST